jgi:hypothetical protein
VDDSKLRALATVVIAALIVGVLVYRSFERLLALARRGTPRNSERQQAIATLCEQRGMVPNPVNLATALSDLIPMVMPLATALSDLIPMVMPSLLPVYENSFASPDGSLWVADLWTPQSSTVSFRTTSDRKRQWDSFSMLSFVVPGLNLPYVGVTRKGEKSSLGFARGNPLTLESIDFDARFMIRAEDRRSAVMLLDEGMMQWLLDCDHVSFEISGDRGQALVKRSSESTYQPGLVPGWHLSGHSDAPHGRSRRADPVELELLFKFWDGFVPRLPAILRAEFGASTT